MRHSKLVFFLVVTLCASCYSKPPPIQFQRTVQESGTTARLQAVSAPNRSVVWASGLEGTVLRTVDAGAHWVSIPVPGSESLQFRDVHAFDENHAFLLSAGDGEKSRIYRTIDGGANWDLQFTVTDERGFLDCFDFWDSQRGLAYGDSIDGELYVLQTRDGGENWSRVDSEKLPRAGTKEGGFAASGGCVRAVEGGTAWIGTGAGGNARVLHTDDYGASWDVSDTPIVKGESAGVMSIVNGANSILVFGGDLEGPEVSNARVARSSDRGKTWMLEPSPSFTGAIFGAAFGGSSTRPLIVAVGPKGVAISHNNAQRWVSLETSDFWAAAFGAPFRFWAVGPEGAVLRFDSKAP